LTRPDRCVRTRHDAAVGLQAYAEDKPMTLTDLTGRSPSSQGGTGSVTEADVKAAAGRAAQAKTVDATYRELVAAPLPHHGPSSAGRAGDCCQRTQPAPPGAGTPMGLG
jgi:hypothetical protein